MDCLGEMFCCCQQLLFKTDKKISVQWNNVIVIIDFSYLISIDMAGDLLLPTHIAVKA